MMFDALRILIVEDEAPILLQLEAVVEDEGHDVVGTAMSSRDAVRKIKSTPVDVVLVDLNLTDGHTGVDVARAALAADVDVVFMTANPSQVADFVGAAGILAKPFSRAAVKATLRFVAECLQDPPPKAVTPPEFSIADGFAKRAGVPLSLVSRGVP